MLAVDADMLATFVKRRDACIVELNMVVQRARSHRYNLYLCGSDEGFSTRNNYMQRIMVLGNVYTKAWGNLHALRAEIRCIAARDQGHPFVRVPVEDKVLPFDVERVCAQIHS